MENRAKDIEINIVPATPNDVRGMQEVFRRTWLDTYPNQEFGITISDIEDRYKDAFTDDTLKKRAERIAHPKEGHTLLFAKEGEKVIGLCRIIKHQDSNELQAIYVLPEYQRQGIGRMLWGEAQKFFDTNKDITTKVALYNNKAIEFYKKLGFEDTGRQFIDEKYKMKSGAVIKLKELIKKSLKRNKL